MLYPKVEESEQETDGTGKPCVCDFFQSGEVVDDYFLETALDGGVYDVYRQEHMRANLIFKKTSLYESMALSSDPASESPRPLSISSGNVVPSQ